MILSLLIIFLGLASAAKKEYVSPEHLNHLKATGQDEEFARLLGVDVSLVHENTGERSEGSIFNRASPFGDFLVQEEDDEDERQGINFGRYGGSKWQYGCIPVAFSDEFTTSEKNFMITALINWNDRVTNLKICSRTWQQDYVYVIPGNGCWSYLGRVGGQQPLSLQKNGCFSNGTVQHEFMHAAGFAHEHNREDRDQFVDVLWENIPQNWHSQYEKVNSQDFINIGDYGYDSVMHYPIWAPETYKDAFRIKRAGVDRDTLGQSVGMSGNDVYKIDYLYS